MEYIRSLLTSLDQLEPIPTGVEPSFSKDDSIKAVIFDIYGTLLISSSGDVEQAEITIENLEKAFEASDIKIIEDRERTLDHVLKDFEYTINVCHQAARNNAIPYPEIDILSIWEIVLIHAKRKKLVEFDDDVNIMRMTCTFEFLSNKVYPMPKLKETISSLLNKKLPLGIVSNAQFYTPVLVNYYLNDSFRLDEVIEGFDPELTVYSYKLGIGKPDAQLYKELLPPLRYKYKLEPHEVLFVGNDMLKDVFASSCAGFKTALFAGDKRSLRWRKDDKRIDGLKPDHVITDLTQVLEII